MNVTRCSRCGTERIADGTPCLSCGSGDINIEVATGELLLMGERPGTVLGDPNNHWLKVNAPTGSRSESSLVDGRVRTTVEGPVDVGERGEPRVRDMLVSVMLSAGAAVAWRPGVNANGEDAILIIAGKEVPLQITTAPPDPGFWQQQAQLGSATTDVTVDH